MLKTLINQYISASRSFNVRVHLQPETLPASKRARLLKELRSVARECFGEIPEYQCLLKDGSGLADKVIAVARDQHGELLGFSSAARLSVPEVGDVLHLGLTCVSQQARGLGLTHTLSARLLTRVLLTRSPLKRLWISNVACVLSSLGNVARHFEEVYPSPYFRAPSVTHVLIAESISRHHRALIAIEPEATFDREAFVFRGSVQGTMFMKSPQDTRYFHRDLNLTQYYLDLMNLNHGDEACQVGWISLHSIFTYQLRRSLKSLRRLIQAPSRLKATPK